MKLSFNIFVPLIWILEKNSSFYLNISTKSLIRVESKSKMLVNSCYLSDSKLCENVFMFLSFNSLFWASKTQTFRCFSYPEPTAIQCFISRNILVIFQSIKYFHHAMAAAKKPVMMQFLKLGTRHCNSYSKGRKIQV